MTQTIERPRADTQPEVVPATRYEERRAHFAGERDHYQRRSDLNGNINVALFLLAVSALIVGWLSGAPIFFIAAGVLAVALIAAFTYHTRIDAQLQRRKELWAINDEGLLRLQRDWQRLPLRQPTLLAPATEPIVANDEAIPYLATDLDLLGHASLQHLLNTPGTSVGLKRLRNWLFTPATPTVIRQRQAAVADLAARNDFRDDLAVAGRLMGMPQPAYEPFVQWAEGASWLAQRPWLIWLPRVTAVATIILGALQLFAVVRYPLWLIPVIINLGITFTLGKDVHIIIDNIADRQRIFASYAALFHIIGVQTFATPELQALQAKLTAGGLRADQQMQRMYRIMQFAEIRHSLYAIVLQAIGLWNFHVLWFLEAWQHDVGQHARAWLDALGDMEALAALAMLAHDHPDWALPEIVVDGPPLFDAVGLGHPLLAPAKCVRNDVAIGPPGTFLLVTGSNMSGKSTLLRAIGLNVVLAQAGGPVCAARLRLSPLTLATSVRVQDSLEEGVSYFMAELQRLKLIVDEAEQAHVTGERTLLFLLDEILHGTNTGERQIAARQIIQHLLAQAALGAVSTHDLTLADTPAFATVGTPVHFTETFTRSPAGPSMTFDYHLRPGIATSTNALKLMEIVGLPLE